MFQRQTEAEITMINLWPKLAYPLKLEFKSRIIVSSSFAEPSWNLLRGVLAPSWDRLKGQQDQNLTSKTEPKSKFENQS